MSECIGKIDSKNEIIDLLKIYNKYKGHIKKIQKNALIRLDRFVNIFMKTLLVNCAEMLASLKLVCLTNLIFYTVYDIMINGDQQFTKHNYERFQNILVRGQMEQSSLTFDNKKTWGTQIFDLKARTFVHKVFSFWGITAHPRISNIDQLIEFILFNIFEATGDCEIITTEHLSDISKRKEFVQLDECFGSFDILNIDKLQIDEEEE
jgi:hypothetical protein